MYKKYIKRLLDLVISLIVIVFFVPFMLIIAVIIKVDSPGSVFFIQKRVGLNKTYFNMIKFRTMKTDSPKETPTHLLEAPEQYISRFGRAARKISLDETPQILHILTGKMSFIGPRPALWNQYDLINERDKYGVNAIKPGLTGWAQINGRDELPIEMKAKYDGEYVSKMSFIFDCKCFFGTIVSVIRCDGIVEGRPDKSERDMKK